MPTEVREALASSARPTWRAMFADGTARQSGDGVPAFTLRVPSEVALKRILASDSYSLAMAYVKGEFDVDGDLPAAIRFKGWRPQSRLRAQWFRTIARCATLRECFFQSQAESVRHIRFHYDRSNEFYRLFLDPGMIYSCAYFRTPGATLEEAQLAKLDHICCKLDLQPGERFLDIGCGWGALVEHAARRYGVEASGCTVSRAQYEHASRQGGGQVRILEQDYRDVSGHFDKIASVGMFEHVGRRALQYFRKIAALLE